MNEQEETRIPEADGTEAEPALTGSTEPEENAVAEPAAEQTTEAETPSYTYRWTYDGQRAFDEKERKRKNRRSAIVFSCVMAVAFLAVIGLLVGVLAFRDRKEEKTGMTTEEVANAVLPSTVLIYSSSSARSGFGTGFFVRQDGYIATNYHVISEATTVTVMLYPSGKQVGATVVGYSSAADLAVLKIEGKGYPVAKIGNSDRVRVGDVAIAIGNPAGISAPWSTTQGIISSTARSVSFSNGTSISEMHMIQTDAPVNPGNSGGPLCNDRAEVIGIVTEKLTDYESLGFAIPINGAMQIIESIIQTGSAENSQSELLRTRPTIGIEGKTIRKNDGFSYMGNPFTAQADGVLVASVSEQSGANGILQPGDLIVAIDGKSVSGIEDLIEILYSYHGGDKVVLQIYPRGRSESTDVVLTLGSAC